MLTPDDLSVIDRAPQFCDYRFMGETENQFSFTRSASVSAERKKEVSPSLSVGSTTVVVNELITNSGGRSYGHFNNQDHP